MSEASKTPETTDLVDRLRTEQAYIIRYRQSIGAEGDYLCQEAANEIESLARRLREAEKDTMRLDWLQNSPLADVRIVGYGSPRRRGGTLRNAIDAARSREGKE